MPDAASAIAMKNTHNLIKLLLGVICLSGLTAGLAVATTGNTNESARAQPVGLFNNKKDLSGAVTAKIETSLTVNNTVILVTDATTIMKGGQAIKLADVQVGDHVKVTASKGDNDMLTANSIEILPASSSATS